MFFASVHKRDFPLIFFRRCQIIKELQINEEIRVKEVRLIDSNGDQLGIVSVKEAQSIANTKNLDLVMIAPTAEPPVCRVLDYGKYRYELMKKEKEAKKKQKIINVKEIRLSPNIEEHDLSVKAKTASKMLVDGDKVKVQVRFRGREMGHTELGEVVLKDFFALLSEVSVIEKPAKLEGRNMTMILAPKPE